MSAKRSRLRVAGARALLLCSGLVVWPSESWATDPLVSSDDGAPRVVLLMGFSPGSALLAQLRVELLAMRFTVVVAEGMAPSRAKIEKQMRARSAAVSVIGREDENIEVLVAGGASLLVTPPEGASDRIVAMRIAEQIRASLVLREAEAESSPTKPGAAEAGPPRPGQDEEAPQEVGSTMSLSLGAGVEVGRGGLGGVGRGSLVAELFPLEHWGITAFAHAPFASQSVSSAGSSADIWAWNFGLGASFRQRFFRSAELRLGAGGGGATVRVLGTAAPPEVAVTEVVHPALLFASISGLWQPSERFFIGARATGTIYIPQLRVHFTDNVVAQRDLFVFPEAVVGLALF